MKDSINSLQDNSICLETRTIFFFEEITSESMQRFIKNLHILDNYKEGDINIKMSSEGGCVASGFAMYDAIKACESDVNIYGYSEIASMATVVFQAGNKRILMPNSYMLLHWGDQTISGHPKSNENWLKLYKDLDDRCNKIYLEKINNRQKEKKKKQIQVQELEKMLDFDTVILPKKVVSLGLADLILEDSY